MTDKPTPTDAELKALWQIHAADIGGIFYYARAVLAKWGQPAQAEEPVATQWLAEMVMSDCGCSTGNQRLLDRIIDRIQQYDRASAAPQPVAREPLPKFLALKFHARRDKKATVTLLFPGHEAADAWVRGIKGGQHGTE